MKSARSIATHGFALSLLATVLAGCAAGPDYVRPALDLPARYTRDAAIETGARTDDDASVPLQRLAPGIDAPVDWWKAFGSRPLDAWVDRSLAHNPGLDAADAALRAARESAAAEQAAFWPSVALNYAPTRQRVSSAIASPLASNETLYTLHTAQVTVSYAPDVFGGTRRQVEGANAQAEVQRFQANAARLSLAANVVNAAITEASLRAQQQATREIIAAQKEVLGAYRRQLALGQASAADVDAQDATLAATEATLPAIERQLAQQRNLLATLSGRYPGDASMRADEAFDLAAFQLPLVLPSSLPSRLVENRPDVRAAEAQLQAASAAIGVAVAARLPNVMLGVNSYGVSATSLSQLFQSSSLFWTLAASVTQPVFDGGALRHREAAARASFDQAAAQYRATVLGAFQDAANALDAIDSDRRGLATALRAERTAAQGLERVQRQVRLGDASALMLRQAEQARQQATLALIQARSQQLSDTVALYLALGGTSPAASN